MNPWYAVIAVGLVYLMFLPLPYLAVPGKPIHGGYAGLSGIRPPVACQ